MFSGNLKKYRKERRLSRRELAASVHVSPQTVSEWEKGFSVPDAGKIYQIAEVLHVDPGKLLSIGNSDSGYHWENIADQVIEIHQQLAVKNRRSRLIMMRIAIVILVILVVAGAVYPALDLFKHEIVVEPVEFDSVDYDVASDVYVSPEMFVSETNGTDCEMIQAAVDYALQHRCGVIFERMYTLYEGETIYINKQETKRYPTYFKGPGGFQKDPEGLKVDNHQYYQFVGSGIIKKSSGYIFSADDDYDSSDLYFEDLSFVSEAGAGTVVFDMRKLLRMKTNNCHYKNVDHVAYNEYSEKYRDQYWQSIRFTNDTVVGGRGFAYDGTGCYDVVFENVLIEWRESGIHLGGGYEGKGYSRCNNLTIRDCCIEVLHGEALSTTDGVPNGGIAIDIQNPVSVTITGCFFERNLRKNINISGNMNRGFSYSVNIRDCVLSGHFYYNTWKDVTDEYHDCTYLVTVSGRVKYCTVENCVSTGGGVIDASEAVMKVYYKNNVYYTWSKALYRKVKGKKVNTNELTGQNAGEENCIMDQTDPTTKRFYVKKGKTFIAAKMTEYGMQQRITFTIDLSAIGTDESKQFLYDFNAYDEEHENPYRFKINGSDVVSVLLDEADTDGSVTYTTGLKDGKLQIKVYNPTKQDLSEKKLQIYVTVLHFLDNK